MRASGEQVEITGGGMVTEWNCSASFEAIKPGAEWGESFDEATGARLRLFSLAHLERQKRKEGGSLEVVCLVQ